VIFHTQDFEKPIIIHFKVEKPDNEEFKVNWKDVETMVSKKFDCLKVVYSRADKHEGDLAISSFRVNQDQLKELASLKTKIGEHDYTFTETQGEDLKEFWQHQGGHYQFCTAPKKRLASKQMKKAQEAKREETQKRQKQAFTIAGVYYMDINKVKSKARAILNMVKDGEKLETEDEAFIKELLKFHQKYEQKLKDFSHFEVGLHPEYNKTRCFFVVRKDGAKEDFSVSKCILSLESHSA
jgi:hypothetical protein